jgi:hypothetical protein
VLHAACKYTNLNHYSCRLFAKFWLSGAFAKLQEATISYVMSVRPSIRMEQLGYHWTDFHEILYLTIFKKYIEKIKVALNSDNNKGYFT